MRLTAQQQGIIHNTAIEMFGAGTKVTLFGSRTNDQLRGGDIDLLLEVPVVITNRPAAAARFAGRLQQRLGDQRIDVLLIDPSTPIKPVHHEARQTGISL